MLGNLKSHGAFPCLTKYASAARLTPANSLQPVACKGALFSILIPYTGDLLTTLRTAPLMYGSLFYPETAAFDQHRMARGTVRIIAMVARNVPHIYEL